MNSSPKQNTSQRTMKNVLFGLWGGLLVLGYVWLALPRSQSTDLQSNFVSPLEIVETNFALLDIDDGTEVNIDLAQHSVALVFLSEECDVCRTRYDEIERRLLEHETERKIVVIIDSFEAAQRYRNFYGREVQVAWMPRSADAPVIVRAVPSFAVGTGDASSIYISVGLRAENQAGTGENEGGVPLR